MMLIGLTQSRLLNPIKHNTDRLKKAQEPGAMALGPRTG